jgi:hypothetical protein
VAAERAIAFSPRSTPVEPSEKRLPEEIAGPRFTFTEDELEMLEELK